MDDRKRREIRSERMSHFSDENNAYTRKNFYRFVEKHIKAYDKIHVIGIPRYGENHCFFLPILAMDTTAHRVCNESFARHRKHHFTNITVYLEMFFTFCSRKFSDFVLRLRIDSN